MTTRAKIRTTFIVILALSIGAGFVDYPKGPDIRLGSWTKELKVHLGLDLQGGAHLVYDANVSGIPVGDRASALEGTRDVIERRVNAFGVSEPLVQTSTSGEASRVIVELPGITNVQDAIDQIGQTPLLEFREQPAATPLTDEQQRQIDDSFVAAKAKADQAMRRLENGEDFAALANELSDDPGNTGSDGAKQGGDLGYQDPSIYVTEFKEALQALQDGQRTTDAVKTIFGYHIIERVATRTENVNGADVEQIDARHILFKALTEADVTQQSNEYVNTELSGKQLTRALVTFDQQTGLPEVTLSFDGEGQKLFAEITKRNVGRTVAIYLDGVPISVPTVQEEITSGDAVISGRFTLQQAKELANRLNAGALPVPISLVEQRTVGATLGADSVERSFVAGIVGILLVALFMIFYYRVPGLLAVAALTVYALLVLAIFKLWPVTLTLAGVAGFILSIGMAVDANVLIFERLKEEVRLGKPLSLAMEEGFQRAWPSIRDSNVSSLITCLILVWFGSSVIKGFAVTLAIGILVSMFSAITVTRTFLRVFGREWLLRHPRLLGVPSRSIDQP